jgi:hypothetical protein
MVKLGREIVDLFIEKFSEGKIKEGIGKTIYELVELRSKDKVGKSRRKVINILVEPESETKVSDERWKGGDGVVEYLPSVDEYKWMFVAE